jgi:stromal membrane-associated protein
MATVAMWTSKLGNKYPMAVMQQNDQAAQKELKRLRGLSGNSRCADCGVQDNSWASVSHGVFICVTCSDVHRSVGTHVTKVKGCTGTYLWGPDELTKMQTSGNQEADANYGTEKVSPRASKEQKQRYVSDKYEKRSFAGKSAPVVAHTLAIDARTEQPQQSARRPPVAERVRQETTLPSRHCGLAKAAAPPVASKVDVSDSFFDDFFNEDSQFGNSAEPLKSNLIETVQLAHPPCPDIDSSSLDAFLNATLKANTQTSRETVFDCPPSLDTFQLIQTSLASDPFADWPEF